APNNREVAAFIGNMNFFDARVKAASRGTATVDAGALGKMSAQSESDAFSSGDKVLVAIRPEKFSIAAKKPGNGVNAVKGTLDNAAYLGERSHFYVKIEGVEQPVAVSAQNANRNLEGFGDQQRSVWLCWPSDAVVLLGAN
ncbi:MAG: TOBE domain-containing protein, partial [Aestuariivirgaceae bacterium]